jgi:hypothetical protein
VVDRIVEHLAPTEEHAGLPKCGVRATCRWFRQNGIEACKICPLVITQIAENGAADVTTRSL